MRSSQNYRKCSKYSVRGSGFLYFFLVPEGGAFIFICEFQILVALKKRGLKQNCSIEGVLLIEASLYLVLTTENIMVIPQYQR